MFESKFFILLLICLLCALGSLLWYLLKPTHWYRVPRKPKIDARLMDNYYIDRDEGIEYFADPGDNHCTDHI